MKIIGIVGSLDEQQSYNELLLQYIQKRFTKLFDLEILDISDIPLFDPNKDISDTEQFKRHVSKLTGADGVLISTGEHSRSIPPVLKSYLEWMSYKVHPLENKPLMVIGASYLDQGTSSSQLHLRQVLEAPGVGAYVFPGNEFLLGEAPEAFDEAGDLKDEGTVKVLGGFLGKFKRFVKVIREVEVGDATDEDLFATGNIATTIDVEKNADNWVELATEKVHPAQGDDYVLLDSGILTVNQISEFLKSMPQELTFADENNQFLYYNYNTPTEEMLAKRKPSQVGNPLAKCHPPRVHENVKKVVHMLRTGQTDTFRLHVPTHGPDKFVVHTYQRITDEDGNYRGINEYIQDIKPTVDWYLQQTGQELVGGKTDANSGASAKEATPVTDGDSGASVAGNEAPAANPTDADSSASNNAESAVKTPDTDASSGASEH